MQGATEAINTSGKYNARRSPGSLLAGRQDHAVFTEEQVSGFYSLQSKGRYSPF